LTTPTQDEIEDADEEFWRWIFRENDGPNHPLKISNDGKAQIQRGRLLIVAGSLPDDIPKNRLLQIPPGIDNVFVPAENCVYTYADGDGETDQELIDKANKDMADSKGRVWVKDEEQTLDRLPGHTFSPRLNIQKCIDGAGKSGKGEGESCAKGMPPEETRVAAAACDYAVIRSDTLKNGDIIKIEGEGRAGTKTMPRRIDVTYKVQKLSEASS
jgi:hypothetical protein